MRRTYEIIMNVIFFFVIYFILFAILRASLEDTIYKNSASIISAATAYFSKSIYRKWTISILNKFNIK